MTIRRFLLELVARFVAEAREVPGVVRIAMVGSLTTEKQSPKDADVLVTIGSDVDMELLARVGRRLRGSAQTRNHSADIFLADLNGHYLGRTCGFRECHPRARCLGMSCGRGSRIRDDFSIVRLSDALVAEPPLELWPEIMIRTTLPADVREVLLGEGRAGGAPGDGRTDGAT